MNEEFTIETFEIESELVDCEGEEITKCMVVNGSYFYDSIDDFIFESGYNYTLGGKITDIPEDQIPMDGSSKSYELLRLIDKVEVN